MPHPLFLIPVLVLSCRHGPISHTPKVLFRILPIPSPQTTSKTPAPLPRTGIPSAPLQRQCRSTSKGVGDTDPGHPARDHDHDQEQQSRDGDATERLNIPPAEQREEARRAGRRLVHFGFRSQGVDEDRPVEAVQNNKVVEASFAKGEWAIRWANASA
ncbi:hypothetical protein JCM24511_05042 [Saitozyma sp. JCM 24511]|nr:hypothetical protein JCM24511_05042 [Saitozyma sp. JCM 24511]